MAGGERFASPSERAAAEHDALRERILHEAEAMLVADGPAKLSLRGIARRIGYAPASLYHYFPDKEAILRGIVERGARRIGAAIRDASETESDPLEALRAAFRAYIGVNLERPELARLVYMMRRPGSANLAPGASERNPNLVHLARLLRAARDSGEIAVTDVDLATRCIWTAAQGLVIRLALDGGAAAEERDSFVEAYLDILIRGLKEKTDEA